VGNKSGFFPRPDEFFPNFSEFFPKKIEFFPKQTFEWGKIGY